MVTAEKQGRSAAVRPRCPFLATPTGEPAFLCFAQSPDGTPVKPAYAGSFCVKMRHVTCRYFVRADPALKRAALTSEVPPWEAALAAEQSAEDAAATGERPLSGRSPAPRERRPAPEHPAVERRPAAKAPVPPPQQGPETPAPAATAASTERAIPAPAASAAIPSAPASSLSRTQELAQPAPAPAPPPQTESQTQTNPGHVVAVERAPRPAPPRREEQPESGPQVRKGFPVLGIIGAASLVVTLAALAVLAIQSASSGHPRATQATSVPPTAVPVVPALPSPRGLLAAQTSATGLALSWRPVPGASRYVVTVAGHRYRARRPHLHIAIGLQPEVRYSWRVEAFGRNGQRTRSQPATIDVRPLPTRLWLLDAIPTGTGAELLLYNPGQYPAEAHIQPAPGTAVSADTASIPPSSSVAIALRPAPVRGNTSQLGALVTATTPILAQRIEASGNSTTAIYGLPVVSTGGAPAPPSGS